MPETVGTRSVLAAIGRPPTRREWLGFAASLATLGALLAIDIELGTEANLSGTFAATPFIAAVFAGVRATAVVAALMLIAAALSPIWNVNFAALDYDVRLVVLLGTAALAVLGAYGLERSRANARRLELLGQLGAIADGSLSLDHTLRKVTEAVVPAVADFCLIDALRGGHLQRVAVRVAGRDDAEAMERWLREREPTIPDVVIAPGPGESPRPNLWRRMPDRVLREMSHGEADLEQLRVLAPGSAIAAPMAARGREIGVLTLGVGWSGRRYGDADVILASSLAGRVGLALDNAGLFTDLESAERRLDSVMSIVDEAVLIHDTEGNPIYANHAATELLGFETPQEAVRAPKTILGERFRVTDETGGALEINSLIGRREQPAELVVRAMETSTREERWYLSRAKTIAGPDGEEVHAVTVIEDVTDVKRAELGSRLLAGLGERLAAAADPRTAFDALIAVTVPELADSCEVEPAGSESVRVAGAREGEAVLLPETGREGEGSLMLVPITAGTTELGILSLTNRPDSRIFDHTDLELAAELGRRAGAAIERARVAEERADVAEILQRGLLPTALPAMSNWEAAAMYRPAGEVNEVGGDFYDAFPIGDGWMIVVGDVVGRGAAAASLTALARHTIRAAGTLTRDPAVALTMLNEALLERSDQALCTVAIALLPDARALPDAAAARIVAAGHPLPLRLRSGAVEEVGAPGQLLGAFRSPSWELEEVELARGDQLVIYTDGVTEARGADDRFGEERLHASLAGATSPLAAVSVVEAALDQYIPGEPQDDAALLVVGRRAAPAPRSAARTHVAASA